MTGPASFTPPKLLAELVTAALAHGRSFLLNHEVDNGGSPFVTLTVKWAPEGCDIPTEVRLTWHTRNTGTYRLFSAITRGYSQGWRDITGKYALQLITGETCFYRRSVA